MEIIGRMPVKGEGFTAEDIEGLGPYFRKLMNGDMIENVEKVRVLNLNNISENVNIQNLSSEHQGRVLILGIGLPKQWEHNVGQKKFIRN